MSGDGEPADQGPAAALAHVVVMTGRSGAGRTTAINALEDCGYQRVETPALSFLPEMARQMIDDGADRVAIGVDARAAGPGGGALSSMIDRLRALDGIRLTVVFLDGADETLRRRYTETRRRHPMSADGSLEHGLALDRERAAPLRDAADRVIDTSHLSPAELKRVVRERIAGAGASGLAISVVSFAYRNGLPEDADLVFDCRFLRNPHYEPALRARTGRDREVAAFVAGDVLYDAFLDQVLAHARLLLPAFSAEGKSYVTFAFGCTGGKHRSIALAEAFAEGLRGLGWRPRIRHREHPIGDGDAPPANRKDPP